LIALTDDVIANAQATIAHITLTFMFEKLQLYKTKQFQITYLNLWFARQFWTDKRQYLLTQP